MIGAAATAVPGRLPLAAWAPLLAAAGVSLAVPGHSPVFAAALLVGLAARALLDARGRPGIDAPTRSVLWALLPVFGAVWVGQAAAAGGPAGSHALALLPLVQVLLLLGPPSGLVTAFLLGIAGLTVAGASLLAPSLWMSAAAVAWVVTLVPAVLALERRAFSTSLGAREVGVRRVRAEGAGTSSRAVGVAGETLRATLALLLLGLPLGWLLFAALPRSPLPRDDDARERESGRNERGRGPGGAGGGLRGGGPDAEDERVPLSRDTRDFLSGVRRTMTLGFVANVQRDETPVLQVKVGGGERGPEVLTLRGLTYDVYTGTEWRRSPAAAREVRAAAGEASALRWVPVAPSTGGALWRLQVVDLTGRGDGLLFLMPDAERVRMSPPHLEAVLRISGDGSVASSMHLGPGDWYLEDAVEAVTDRERLRGRRSDAALAPWPALATPFDEAFFGATARALTGGATEAAERAIRLEAALRAGWTYRLRTPEGRPPPTVRQFLEERTPASCEWFASAMVLMMRALGHPSRLAVGFRAGPLDYMESLGQWSVRASHAHAWCEVHFEGVGWTLFDPTPSSPEEGSDAGGEGGGGEPSVWQRLARWSQEDRAWFQERLAAGVAAVGRLPWLPVLLATAAASVGLALLLARRRRRRRARTEAGGSPQGRTAWAPYRRAVAALEGEGVVRAAPQTASEYAARAAGTIPALAPPFDGLTRTYEALRYGGREPGDDERRAAEAAAETVEKTVAARRRLAREDAPRPR